MNFKPIRKPNLKKKSRWVNVQEAVVKGIHTDLLANCQVKKSKTKIQG